MRSSSMRVVAVIGAGALAVGIGSALATEGDDADETVVVTASDDELIERLLEIEEQLPPPLPSTVDLNRDNIDVQLAGSFSSARSTFDALEGDLRALFVDADEADSTVAEAIADVTFGLLTERQALTVLEETDPLDEARPLDATDARDDDDNAIDADGLYGRLQTGLDILLEARELQRAGYDVLADLPEGADDAGVFDDRLAALTAYRDTTGIRLRTIASQPTEQLFVVVERFEAPLGVAHVLGVTYVCVDREAYFALADASPVERIAGSVEPADAACTQAAQTAGLSLSEQVAVDDLLDGVETAVGTG